MSFTIWEMSLTIFSEMSFGQIGQKKACIDGKIQNRFCPVLERVFRFQNSIPSYPSNLLHIDSYIKISDLGYVAWSESLRKLFYLVYI